MTKQVAEFKLLETGTLVDFDIISKESELSPDKENLSVKVDLQITDEDDTDPEDIVEWAAFGFIFVIASLSFHDGRPRGMSGLDFEKEDQFNVADFLEGLTYRRDGLRFHGDYIRGRSLKTEIIVRINGTVAISTWGRGESLYRWLDLMKGKKTLRAVTGVDDQ
jgi:hypothetical protein